MNNLITELQNNGLIVASPILDGSIKRCATTDKPKGKTGWYIGWTKYLSSKDIICCSMGDWTKGNDALATYKSWEHDTTHKFSQSDLDAIKATQADQQRKVEAAKVKQHKEAAKKSTEQWLSLSETGNSRYLESKGVKGYGLRYGNDSKEGDYIAIPIRNHDGDLKGLQLIYDNPLSYDTARNKTFTSGVEKKGNFHLIGSLTPLTPLCFVEGYATGASVHETTGYPVIVCFDAGNLKPVIEVWRKKYPTQNLIICADNDQWKPVNTGIIKATEAAKAHDCFLAIPDFTGLTKTKGWIVHGLGFMCFSDIELKPTDFNDLHTLAGGDCVKAIIHNAAKVSTVTPAKNESEPTDLDHSEPDWLDNKTLHTDHDKPTTVDGVKYPNYENRPCYLTHENGFKTDLGAWGKAGTYLHSSMTDKNGEVTLTDTWICSPLVIESVTLDQHHNNYGRFLRFKPTRGGWRKWCMPMSLLSGTGDALRAELLSKGVLIDFDNQKMLPRYLTHFVPKETLEVATQTGWHKGAYILPESCIGSDDYFYQSENVHTDVPYRQAGSLEQWQQHIARYCVGNPLLILQISGAFTGALLRKAHQEGGGVHIVGGSSKGKSAGLEMACSVFGDDTYKRTWKATGNGMESVSTMFNDGFLALDEIGECQAKEVGNIVYSVANGIGKSRANKNGGAKASNKWRVFVISNGEVSIESAMQEAGQRVKAGQLMRLLNIPIFGKYGAFNELHDKQDGRALADHLKTASLNYYGVAGIEYLTKLVAEQRNINELAERYTVALIDGEPLSSQESRAAKRFALVALAGELATEYGITGWKRGDASKGVKECFKQWRKSFGGGDTEDRQIKEAVQAYIEMYGDARFTNTNDDTRLHGVRSGYWKDGVHGREWLFSKSGLMEAIKGYDLKKSVDVLKQCGWLIVGGEGLATTKVRIKNNETGESRFYRICFIENVPVVPVSGTKLEQLQTTNGVAVPPVPVVPVKNSNVLSETSEKIKMPLNNRGMI